MSYVKKYADMLKGMAALKRLFSAVRDYIAARSTCPKIGQRTDSSR